MKMTGTTASNPSASPAAISAPAPRRPLSHPRRPTDTHCPWPLGGIVGAETTPSNELFVVQGPRGEILVPVIDDIVKEIDVQGGVMTIKVVPGLIPPERKKRRRP